MHSSRLPRALSTRPLGTGTYHWGCTDPAGRGGGEGGSHALKQAAVDVFQWWLVGIQSSSFPCPVATAFPLPWCYCLHRVGVATAFTLLLLPRTALLLLPSLGMYRPCRRGGGEGGSHALKQVAEGTEYTPPWYWNISLGMYRPCGEGGGGGGQPCTQAGRNCQCAGGGKIALHTSRQALSVCGGGGAAMQTSRQALSECVCGGVSHALMQAGIVSVWVRVCAHG